MALEITDQSIDEVLSQNEITVIDFSADWCGPCKMLGPVIDQLSLDNPDIVIGKLDVMSNELTSRKYDITGIPCVIFFKNGEEVDRVKGVLPKSALQEKINELKN
jgi:thioredoxin 1